MSNITKAQDASCFGGACETRERSEWSYAPAIDLFELPDAYVIEADAPGLKSDGIEITYEAGTLHLHGAVATRHAEHAKFLRQEYGVGDFDREIPLGRIAEFVDAGKSEAEYAHGVLTIRLPKLEVAQPRRIEVKKSTA
jgi:HSP20 family protein